MKALGATHRHENLKNFLPPKCLKKLVWHKNNTPC